MAEINSAAAKPKKGVRRSKKLSTRVDLTPMVDLGFLLITFFIFTTTISEPAALNIKMPASDKPDSSKIGESGALTIIPVSNNQAFYYHGELEEAFRNGSYGFAGYTSSGGLGDVIRQKQSAMDRVKPGSRKDLMLLIKPSEASNVQNFVDILDEVTINAIPRYAVMDIPVEEKNYLATKNIKL